MFDQISLFFSTLFDNKSLQSVDDKKIFFVYRFYKEYSKVQKWPCSVYIVLCLIKYHSFFQQILFDNNSLQSVDEKIFFWFVFVFVNSTKSTVWYKNDHSVLKKIKNFKIVFYAEYSGTLSYSSNRRSSFTVHCFMLFYVYIVLGLIKFRLFFSTKVIW